MPYVVRRIEGQRSWYERIFREKALRLSHAFGQEFDVSIDEVEDYLDEIHEVFGESLCPEEEFQSNDVVVGTCWGVNP